MKNRYSKKSIDELKFIISDASEAARCAQSLGHFDNESKYLDQVNDACSELARRAGNYWLQEQAPAGNWVDSIGSSDLDGLRSHAKYLIDMGKKARIVERHDVVVA